MGGTEGGVLVPGVDAHTLYLATVLQAMQAWSTGLRLGTRQVVWHRWQLDGPPAADRLITATCR